MSENKDKLQETEELRKSLEGVLTPEELDEFFKSEDMEEEKEESEEKDEEESEEEKEEEAEKSEKEDLQPRTEEEIKKSIADNITELKKVQGINEPTAIEKSLKETNDKLEKSLGEMREENDELKKSLGTMQETLEELQKSIDTIGQTSQGTKHQVKFQHIEKSGESDLGVNQDGKTAVSVSEKDELEKAVTDSWERSEGAEKELLEKAVVNLNGAGRIAYDQDTLARIARAMGKQGYVLTK